MRKETLSLAIVGDGSSRRPVCTCKDIFSNPNFEYKDGYEGKSFSFNKLPQITTLQIVGNIFIDPNEGSLYDAIKVKCRLRHKGLSFSENHRSQTCFPADVLRKPLANTNEYIETRQNRRSPSLGYGYNDHKGTFIWKQIGMLHLRSTVAHQVVVLGCQSESFEKSLKSLVGLEASTENPQVNETFAIGNNTFQSNISLSSTPLLLFSWKGEAIILDGTPLQAFLKVEIINNGPSACEVRVTSFMN